MSYNSNVHFEEEIQEFVGLDLEGVEHFGQTAQECRDRISDANSTIARHDDTIPFDGALSPFYHEFSTASAQDRDAAF